MLASQAMPTASRHPGNAQILSRPRHPRISVSPPTSRQAPGTAVPRSAAARSCCWLAGLGWPWLGVVGCCVAASGWLLRCWCVAGWLWLVAALSLLSPPRRSAGTLILETTSWCSCRRSLGIQELPPRSPTLLCRVALCGRRLLGVFRLAARCRAGACCSLACCCSLCLVGWLRVVAGLLFCASVRCACWRLAVWVGCALLVLGSLWWVVAARALVGCLGLFALLLCCWLVGWLAGAWLVSVSSLPAGLGYRAASPCTGCNCRNRSTSRHRAMPSVQSAVTSLKRVLHARLTQTARPPRYLLVTPMQLHVGRLMG